MVEIKRYEGKVQIPPICRDENTGKPCINNGKVCRCNVYAGDLAFKKGFRADDIRMKVN